MHYASLYCPALYSICILPPGVCRTFAVFIFSVCETRRTDVNVGTFYRSSADSRDEFDFCNFWDVLRNSRGKSCTEREGAELRVILRSKLSRLLLLLRRNKPKRSLSLTCETGNNNVGAQTVTDGRHALSAGRLLRVGVTVSSSHSTKLVQICLIQIEITVSVVLSPYSSHTSWLLSSC
ncbi:hypothetical protein ABVT39_016338 [Epinephelus coioides]